MLIVINFFKLFTDRMKGNESKLDHRSLFHESVGSSFFYPIIQLVKKKFLLLSPKLEVLCDYFLLYNFL